MRANTLDNELIFQSPHATFELPGAGNRIMMPPLRGRAGAHINMISPMLSDNVDWKAPGVREHMMNPPISLGPYRSSVYDTQRSANQAPMVSFDAASSLMTGPWAQNYGESLYRMVNENKVTEHQSQCFRNTGTWSAPLTGFSALSEIRPNSSLIFM